MASTTADLIPYPFTFGSGLGANAHTLGFGFKYLSSSSGYSIWQFSLPGRGHLGLETTKLGYQKGLGGKQHQFSRGDNYNKLIY